MRVLVTGASGFLGSAITRALVQSGVQVRTLHRSDSPALRALGVQVCRGDVAEPDRVRAAVDGCDQVFHTAARVGVWGHYRDYYRSNVTGTRQLLAACRQYQVRQLIYTSTPSVVFDGRDQENIDESAPYARRFYNAYQETKALAEQMVLEANGASLATVALRPHLIWGERDPHLVHRVLARAKAGRLRLVSGSRKLVDATHIDNAVHAHLAAARVLQVGARCAGRAYFIADDNPLPMRDLLNHILRAAGLPALQASIPAPLAWLAGALSEGAFRLLPLRGEPVMTRFVARQLATAHWYNLAAARRDLEYAPVTTLEDGMARLAARLLSPASQQSRPDAAAP